MHKLILVSFCMCLIALPQSVSAQHDRVARSLRLKAAEKRQLNESLPIRVRNFLETAEEFVILAQLRVEDGKLVPEMDRELVPNFKADVSRLDKRQAVLKAFYAEASKGHQPAICYLPSHSFTAKKGTQRVKVELCFGCRRFYVSGSLGKSEGTLAIGSEESEQLVTKLISEFGVTTK